MFVYLVFSILILALTNLNYYIGRRNVLYPAFLISLVWLAVSCLLMVPLMELDRIGTDTLAIFFSALLAFSGGCALLRGYAPPLVRKPAQPSAISRKMLFFVCLAILPAFYLQVGRLSGAGGLDGFLASARIAMVEALTYGEAVYSNPIYNIVPVLAVFVAFIFMIETKNGREDRLWLFASILVALAFCILTTGRTLILELMLGLGGIYILKSGRTSMSKAWRIVRWPLMAFVILFSLLAPLTKRVAQQAGGASEAIVNYAFGYAVIPLGGFNYVLHHQAEYKYEPNHTFRDLIPAVARVSA